jgi:peroxiredoxin
VVDKRTILRASVLGVIIVALGGALWTAFTSDDAPLQVGEAAPDFTLTTLEGKTVQLSDFEGQGVFINFWASWCEPCKAEMPDMQAQYEAMQGEGVEILAVNIAEGELPVRRFVERYGLTFPVLLDQDRALTRRYAIGDLPTSIFVDKDQNVVAKFERMLSEDEIEKNMQEILP